jgi:Tfp pilus assembly protein PilF
VLKARPDDSDAWFRLGFVQLSREENGEAAFAFETCLRHEPDRVDAALNLGIAYFRMGDRKAATEAFQRVCELDSGNSEAAKGLALLEADAGMELA